VGDDFHWLHLRYFEGNDGELTVPLDKWLGTYRNTAEAYESAATRPAERHDALADEDRRGQAPCASPDLAAPVGDAPDRLRDEGRHPAIGHSSSARRRRRSELVDPLYRPRSGIWWCELRMRPLASATGTCLRNSTGLEQHHGRGFDMNRARHRRRAFVAALAAVALAAVPLAAILVAPAHAQTVTFSGLDKYGTPCPTGGSPNQLTGRGYCELTVSGTSDSDTISVRASTAGSHTAVSCSAGRRWRFCDSSVMMYWFGSAWEVWVNQGELRSGGYDTIRITAGTVHWEATQGAYVPPTTTTQPGDLWPDGAGESLSWTSTGEQLYPTTADLVAEQASWDPDPEPTLPETNLPSDANGGPYGTKDACFAAGHWGCFHHDAASNPPGKTWQSGWYGWSD